MDYIGTIIKESLEDFSVLSKLRNLSTKIEPVTEKHQTPWVKQWTLYKVQIPENLAEEIADEISKNLDYSRKSGWYADYKNDLRHYIVFKNKIFRIDIKNHPKQYLEAKQYGISLGIPEYQLPFGKL